MADETVTFQRFLLDMTQHASKVYSVSPLIETLERDMKERKRKDDEYLASLTRSARTVELTRRRIRRLGNWWNANVAWRLDRYPPDQEEWS